MSASNIAWTLFRRDLSRFKWEWLVSIALLTLMCVKPSAAAIPFIYLVLFRLSLRISEAKALRAYECAVLVPQLKKAKFIYLMAFGLLNTFVVCALFVAFEVNLVQTSDFTSAVLGLCFVCLMLNGLWFVMLIELPPNLALLKSWVLTCVFLALIVAYHAGWFELNWQMELTVSYTLSESIVFSLLLLCLSVIMVVGAWRSFTSAKELNKGFLPEHQKVSGKLGTNASFNNEINALLQSLVDKFDYASARLPWRQSLFVSCMVRGRTNKDTLRSSALFLGLILGGQFVWGFKQALMANGLSVIQGLMLIILLAVIYAGFSLEFAANKPLMARLWMLDNSPTRRTYMAKTANFFALRLLVFTLASAALLVLITWLVAGFSFELPGIWMALSIALLALPFQLAWAFANLIPAQQGYLTSLLTGLVTVAIFSLSAYVVFGEKGQAEDFLIRLFAYASTGLCLMWLARRNWCKSSLK